MSLRTKILCLALWTNVSLLAACATDTGTEPEVESAEATQTLEAPAAGAADASLVAPMTIPPGYSCSLSCNANPGAGGTAYCRAALQEQTARCFFYGPTPSGVAYCCVP